MSNALIIGGGGNSFPSWAAGGLELPFNAVGYIDNNGTPGTPTVTAGNVLTVQDSGAAVFAVGQTIQLGGTGYKISALGTGTGGNGTYTVTDTSGGAVSVAALKSASVTISNASPAVVGWAAHGLPIGALVYFTTTGALPNSVVYAPSINMQLVANQRYYVMAAGYGANAFQIGSEPSGPSINTTSAGSGTHTAYSIMKRISSKRGPMTANHMASYSEQRLSTDAIGTFTLTLQNVAAGSRFRIERAGDGTLAEPTGVAEATNAGTPGTFVNISLTLSLYVGGSANNNLRVKVRKGTAATKFQPFETLSTAQAGTVNAYVAQVADPIA